MGAELEAFLGKVMGEGLEIGVAFGIVGAIGAIALAIGIFTIGIAIGEHCV